MRRRPVGAPTCDDARVSARKAHALELFAGLPSRYDRVGAIMSFGQDPRWRRALVAAVAPTPADRVLDVATGTGLVAAELVRRSGCTVVGVDQSPAMLARAQARLDADPQLAARCTLVRAQAEALPFSDGEFDALTFTYLLRYVDDPSTTLRELARVVRPGGRIAMLEFGVPRAPVARALWRLHTRLGLVVIGGLVSSAWVAVARFLGPSIEELHARVSRDELLGIWRVAGIAAPQARELSFGAGLIVWGTRDGTTG